MTERIHWIDTCKGLLICMVVVSHISDVGCLTGINMPVLFRMGGITLTWKSFYMSLFFMLNAYTTDYDVDLRLFIYKRFKSLMVPAILFSIITTIVEFLIWGESPYVPSLLSVWFYLRFGIYWFLPALFGCNIIFVFLYKFVILRYHPSVIMEMIVMSVISVIGLVLSLHYNNDPLECNLLYYRYVLFYLVFVYAGFKAKTISLPKLVSILFSIFYIISILLCWCLDINTPQFTGWISFTTLQIPFLYILSFTGCFVLVLLSRFINESLLLEYIGKNSLVIYLVHSVIISALFKFALSINCQDFAIITQIAFLIGVFVITLGLSLLFSLFFSLKYVRVLIGKF